MLTVRKQIAARPVFTIVLRPEPHCLDPIKALRAILKHALRSHGLRCIGIPNKLGGGDKHSYPRGCFIMFPSVNKREGWRVAAVTIAVDRWVAGIRCGRAWSATVPRR